MSASSIDRDACHLGRLLALLIANGQIECEGTSRGRRPSIRLPFEARTTRSPGAVRRR